MSHVLTMARETSLRLAKDLLLPLAAATETFAILGRRGSGKTHTAVVMAEEMLTAGVQLAIIDPLDAWSGLRMGKDGKSKGHAIYLFGGAHGDLPLQASSGAVLADAVVDHGLSVVFSLRHLSKTDQRRFVGEFCDRLYDRKGEPAHRTALHVIIDEADAFVPQRLVPGSERAFGAVDTLIRRGRSSGLATTLISQRPQVINKDVLSQTEVLVAHQLTGPQDRKALEAWIEANDVDGRRAEFMASLASLPKGTAWFWSPGLLAIFRKVAVRDRLTFDSSATPAAGARAVSMTTAALAPVDLSALKEKLADTIERAKADDPRELRKTIADLQRQLAAANSSRTLTAAPATVTEVPVLTDADRRTVDSLQRYLEQMAGKLGVFEEQTIAKFEERVAKSTAQLIVDAKADIAHRRAEFEERLQKSAFGNLVSKIAAAAPAQPHRHTVTGERTALAGGDHGPRPSMRVSRPASSGNPPPDGVTGPEFKILTSLAELEALGMHPADKIQLGLLAGYTNIRSGGFSEPLARLIQRGYALSVMGRVAITDSGRRVVGEIEPPQTPDEMQARVMEKLTGPEQKLLAEVIARYPKRVDKVALGEACGYTNIRSGGFSEPLARLIKLGLAESPARGEIVASRALFLEA